MRLLVSEPLILPKGKRLLKLPYRQRAHPSNAFKVSTDFWPVTCPGIPQWKRSSRANTANHPGETQPKNDMQDIYKSGKVSAVDGKLISFHHL